MKLCTLVVIATIALAAFGGCRREAVQLSGGMAPTIKAGERVKIDYSAYTAALPGRWDIVVLKSPWPPNGSSNVVVIKRVVALPAETVSITTNGIVINGALLAMPSALSNTAYFQLEKLLPPRGVGVNFPYAVPAKGYFVVGDNWSNSLDSRYYGAVSETNILGKVEDK